MSLSTSMRFRCATHGDVMLRQYGVGSAELEYYGCPECASRAPVSAGKVKALAWEAYNAKYDGGRSHYGKGIFGHWYCASRAQNREWLLMHHVDGKPCHFSPFPSLDAAQATAQADYEASILSALQPGDGCPKARFRGWRGLNKLPQNP